ncbi:MAG TPA: hypothetical protein VKS81_02540, partial [Bacteroidota bacterium]|nr:hypothetical protein [Bacteroidota bacterium]
LNGFNSGYNGQTYHLESGIEYSPSKFLAFDGGLIYKHRQYSQKIILGEFQSAPESFSENFYGIIVSCFINFNILP